MHAKDILFAIVKRQRGVTLPPLVERKHGEGALDKLTSGIYEIMAYGEGIKKFLPKPLVSSGSSKAENAQTSTSQVIVNPQVPSVLNFDLSAMQATIQKNVDVAIYLSRIPF